jgi:hypothetical protein
MKLLAQILKEAAHIREESWNDSTHEYELEDAKAITQAINRLGYDTRYQFPAEVMIHNWNDCMNWIDSILGTTGGV